MRGSSLAIAPYSPPGSDFEFHEGRNDANYRVFGASSKLIEWSRTGAEAFRRENHDPSTDRPYPLVRAPQFNYAIRNLALDGSLYHLQLDEGLLSFITRIVQPQEKR